MYGVDLGVWIVLGSWMLLVMLCVVAVGLRFHKYLVKKKNIKKKPKLTLIQGGKKDGPYGKGR